MMNSGDLALVQLVELLDFWGKNDSKNRRKYEH